MIEINRIDSMNMVVDRSIIEKTKYTAMLNAESGQTARGYNVE